MSTKIGTKSAKKNHQQQTFSSPLSKFVLLGVLLIVTFIICYLLLDYQFSEGGDDVTYLILSQSLWQDFGYRELWTPQAAKHTAALPLYPLLISPIWNLTHSIIMVKAFIILLFLLSIAGLFLTLNKILKIESKLFLVWMVLLLLVTNYQFSRFSNLMLTEIPFLFLTVGALFLAFRETETGDKLQKKSSSSKLNFWGVLLFLSAAVLIRPAGLALAFSLALLKFLQNRSFKFTLYFFVPFLVFLGWTFSNYLTTSQDIKVSTFMLVNPYEPAAGKLTLVQFLERYFKNLIHYLNIISNWCLMFLPNAKGLGLLQIIVLAVLIYSILRFSLKNKNLLVIGLYMILTVGFYCIWHEVWTDIRFIYPLLPFVLIFFFLGLYSISEKIFARLALSKFKFLLILIIVLISFLGNIKIVQAVSSEQQRKRDLYSQGLKYAGFAQTFADFCQMAEWIKTRGEPGIYVSRKPNIFYFISGKKSINYEFTRDKKKLYENIKTSADFVVVDRFSRTSLEFLIPMMIDQVQAGNFTPVFSIGTCSLWKVVK